MKRVTVECTVMEFSSVVSIVHEGHLDCPYAADISLLAHGFQQLDVYKLWQVYIYVHNSRKNQLYTNKLTTAGLRIFTYCAT